MKPSILGTSHSWWFLRPPAGEYGSLFVVSNVDILRHLGKLSLSRWAPTVNSCFWFPSYVVGDFESPNRQYISGIYEWFFAANWEILYGTYHLFREPGFTPLIQGIHPGRYSSPIGAFRIGKASILPDPWIQDSITCLVYGNPKTSSIGHMLRRSNQVILSR